MKDNVLLISPEFFYYHKIFKRGIEELGYRCDWYSDRPSTNFLTKATLRVSPKLMGGKINKYLNTILKETTNNKYKYVVVIMGEVLSEQFVKSLKESHPTAKYIYVFWDSIVNFGMGLKLVKYFDQVYTTDRGDAKKYKYNFIPLFYNQYIDTTKKETEYDFSFIGTIKHGKNAKINALINEMCKEYKSAYIYKYIQGKSVLMFYKRKYKQEFKDDKLSDFKYDKLDSKTAIDVFKKSKYILDVPMNKQKALTERCFNAMYLGKKLITTNKDIVNYDFYNENNIYVYREEKGIDFNSKFFNSKFEPIEGYEKYSLSNWLKTLLK